MVAPEVAGEIARMERVSDTLRLTTATETAPKVDPTLTWPVSPIFALKRTSCLPFNS